MNILYVVHAYKPAYRVGGPVVSVSAAAEALVRKGHRVTVFTSNSNLDEDLDVPLGRPVNVEGVDVWYFRREEPVKRWHPFVPYLAKSSGLLYTPGVKAALPRVIPGIDIVDTHSPFVYPTYAVSRATFRASKPLFYHQRGCFDPQRLQFRGLKKRIYIELVERRTMQGAVTLVALTETERASFRALGVTTPCAVVPNGVDARPVDPGSADRMRRRYNIPMDAGVLLFLGRLHPVKGADKLLAAFELLPENVRFKSRLIMAGPDEWGLEGKWRHRVNEAGLQNSVIFPGMLSGREKEDVLAGADLFCLPSIGEGFSMAVLEALAAGTAVMLSPGCHFPEAAAAGGGVIVDDAVPPMTAALESLLANREKLREMGEAGRRLVANHYTWDAIADRLVDVYEEGRLRFNARMSGPL